MNLPGHADAIALIDFNVKCGVEYPRSGPGVPRLENFLLRSLERSFAGCRRPWPVRRGGRCVTDRVGSVSRGSRADPSPSGIRALASRDLGEPRPNGRSAPLFRYLGLAPTSLREADRDGCVHASLARRTPLPARADTERTREVPHIRVVGRVAVRRARTGTLRNTRAVQEGPLDHLENRGVIVDESRTIS